MTTEPEPTDQPEPTDYQLARQEAAALLDLDLEHLSAADGLRLDLAVTLRRAIDAQTEAAFDGAPIDLNRLMTAIERLTALLPAGQLPSAHQRDPREALIEIYTRMKERGEIVEREEPAAIDVPTCDIVPACERAECDPGPMPGPDDWKVPPAEGPLIEGELVKPSPRPSRPAKATAPAPAEDVVDLRQGFGNVDEPWRAFCTDTDGVPLSGGRKFWGPV